MHRQAHPSTPTPTHSGRPSQGKQPGLIHLSGGLPVVGSPMQYLVLICTKAPVGEQPS